MAPALTRDDLLADRSLVGVHFCRALSERVDTWLRGLFADAVDDDAGIALVATGGYGRSELSPFSDLDVLLVHAERPDISLVAERLWYPVWDSGLKLGHAVRTPTEALRLAGDDLGTATSLLSMRHLAGDRSVTTELARDASTQWRASARTWLPVLADAVDERHRTFDEVAFLLEPDLKQGRGGMRDVHALRWLQAADEPLPAGDVAALADAYDALLATRVELHRAAGRPGDRLLLELQDEVAASLGVVDADALMAQVSGAARSIAWVSDEAWLRIRRGFRRRWGIRRRRPQEVLPGILLTDDAVSLTDTVALDLITALRLALVAARNQAQIERASVERLAAAAGPLPVPWPQEARELFIDLLACGHAAIPVIETLDQTGLFVAILPEWEPCRSRPQRNAYHRFTVDRHLCEAAAEASKLTSRVDRPDLLLLGALLHDIGKGHPGDHTEVGMALVPAIARRMGFPPTDVDQLVALVEHHLLLPDVATRRDLDDDDTIRSVAALVQTVERTQLLAALTEADSIATGPSAWSTWKAGLVEALAARVCRFLSGGALEREFPTEQQRALLRVGERHIRGEGETLTVVVPDRTGVFNRIAGALSLNGLDVLDASTHSEYGMALSVFRVESAFGTDIRWERVCDDVDRALSGRLAIEARLAERIRTYRARQQQMPSPTVVEPAVLIDNELSSSATVIEVRAPNSVGLLYRITRTLTQLDLDVLRSKVQTLGPDVVDSFYVLDRDGYKITDPDHLREVERALVHASAPPDA